MKKVTLIATMMFIVTILIAQAPQAFKYQAVARDNAGDILANQVVSFRMTILQGALPGTPVYSETHSGATNEFGLITLEIGRGTPVSGNFEIINWSTAPSFLKTELDPAGGSAYVEMGTAELLSTPYALYAKTAETGGTTYTAGSGINIEGTVISNTAENATHTGDATGSGSLTVVKIQGREISTTAPASDQVLQWNGSQWTPSTLSAPPPDWLLNGNAGTVDGTHFVGTTDNVPFNLRVNNQKAGRVASNGHVFLGYQAGNSNTSSNITGLGYQALYFNTTGNYNTANGYRGLFSNTTGSYNTANGNQSLNSNIDGNYNTAIGLSALYYNTSGNNNTANGVFALFNNTTGVNNTAVGFYALSGNIDAGFNTALGYQAGDMITSGNYNTCIGYAADLNANNFTNATAIGNGATATASNQVRIGNSSVSSLFCQGAYTATSSNSPNVYVDANGQIMRSTGTVGSSDWLLTGNAGTVDGTHFVGTTDNVPFNIRVNNQKAGRVTSNGPVFLGYQAGNSNTATNNTGIGYKSLYSNTTGNSNTANGFAVLHFNTTGHHNTATGDGALYSNTTGNYNTANGFGAISSNITGNFNTADGYAALSSNIGSYNTANGYQALFLNTAGQWNTGNGSNALYNNIDGDNNTAVGTNALYLNTAGDQNSAFGRDSGPTTGGLSNTTALGYHATTTASNQVRLGDSYITSLFCQGAYVATSSNSPNMYVDANGQIMRSAGTVGGSDWLLTGNAGTVDGTNFIGTTDNVPFNIRVNNQKAGRVASNGHVFLGYQAGNSNTASNNTGLGYAALYTNTTGNYNTANGYLALFLNNTGNHNTANGLGALYFNNSGSDNTAHGSNALYSNTIGNNNTALGKGAGIDGINHNFCTFIGAYATLTTNRSNVTLLGYGISNAQCTGDNQVLLGNTAITSIRANVTGITAYSDARFKSNVRDDVHGLDFIMRLKPVTYNERPTELHRIWGTPDSIVSRIDHSEIEKMRFIGFLAQDVEKAANDCDFEFPGIDVPQSSNETYSLRYGDFTMPMVKAIQEQQAIIETLQKQVEELKQAIEEMKNVK